MKETVAECELEQGRGLWWRLHDMLANPPPLHDPSLDVVAA